MQSYIVQVQIPVTFHDDELADFAHQVFRELAPGGTIKGSEFLDTVAQAADYAAHDPRFIAIAIGIQAFSEGLKALSLNIHAGPPVVNAYQTGSPPGQHGPTADYGDG
jgi:hypothetical protein